MGSPSSPAAGNGAAALRWIAAGAVALGLHAGVAALLIRGERPEPIAAGGGEAIAVELDPVEGEAAKPDEVQPIVPADEASTAVAAAAPSGAGRATPQPIDTPSPRPDPPPPPVQPQRPVEPPPLPTGEATPDVTAPPPLPVAPAPEPEPPEPPPPAALPVQAQQVSAASAAEDAALAVRKRAAARETAWRGRLVAHLNRYRRFPPGIGSGTARVGFTIDGDGRVTAVSIETGSGDAALDEAARALIGRASPFPPPPPGVDGKALSFVVPIHYDARHP